MDSICHLVAIAALLALPVACGSGGTRPNASTSSDQGDRTLEKATFAGGCFWCMQHPFEELKGVVKVAAGYAGGTGADPTYEDYARKGYIEAIQVTYDPALASFAQLLHVFWRQIDPTDPGGQFSDRGPHYRTAIFYDNDAQKREAEQSKRELAASGRFAKPIATEILAATTFASAEDYHQDYWKTHPARYCSYRAASGRDAFLDKAWGKDRNAPPPPTTAPASRKPSQAELKKKLTPLEYAVTQEQATEPPFQNRYWNNDRAGIYVDIVSGKPLFSSLDKFDSGCGWPSFTAPLDKREIVEKPDTSHGMTRTEVRSKEGDAHLGHLFDDGPKPSGLRFCINSASLRFIPKEDMAKEGYDQYLELFEKKANP